MTNALAPLRHAVRANHYAPEAKVLRDLIAAHAPSDDTRRAAGSRAATLVQGLRDDPAPGLMELFLSEYGLSTQEGVALMCLAEALLRVPDVATIDALIEDKIAPSQWGLHLGQSSSSLVNAATWGLMLTGRVLDDGSGPRGLAQSLRGAVKRLGEPVIRSAVARAMREMGRQFVLGQDMPSAMARAAKMQAKGYTYSYDMLGEAAMTATDADAYFDAYHNAIKTLAPACTAADMRDRPGISIKLSALHPRYEPAQAGRVMQELVSRVRDLARAARDAGMGLNIDAEEAARLDLSLDVIAAVIADRDLSGWDGFGVVVQAYGKRCAAVIDWLHALATQHDRKIMVRLVKGAYWDSEIKLAQVGGHPDFPVFTRKSATDISYLCCAQKLLSLSGRIYPQFATHNAHTVACILEMAGARRDYEFQRLHGMGESLHERVLRDAGTRCRIYAPVGAHRDLLAYLVRRLLENGANSSFVHQVLDTDVAVATVVADPFDGFNPEARDPAVTPPEALFGDRVNAAGIDLDDPKALATLDRTRDAMRHSTWQATPLLSKTAAPRPAHAVVSPADPSDALGTVSDARLSDVGHALDAAAPWSASAMERAETLRRAAVLFEAQTGEWAALLAREAGKTLPDVIGEVREAVDFLRYYADEALKLNAPARGLFTCISPWNFPLAIFTGQIAAALAAGNGVLAKPAEATSLIAHRAVEVLHAAGVPRHALQCLPGPGREIGLALVSDPRIDGVCFTGSTATAQAIHRAMAETLAPDAPLIAETGGLNAMVVDSTALLEQATRDIVTSAFQSAGQRCSALRVLYVQEDIAPALTEMLTGAMAELSAGRPWARSSDLGPVISQQAQQDITDHIDCARHEGRVIAQTACEAPGYMVPPTLISLPGGIADLEREVFGPVLHVTRYRAGALGDVVAAINARGYGLTFGLHSRIDDRVDTLCRSVRAGNIYVNRNQIGAVVGSQPFGGEGLSGTGPKAGGPEYLPRFTKAQLGHAAAHPAQAASVSRGDLEAALRTLPDPRDATTGTQTMPGPTGESNRLSRHPRGRVLCLGPGAQAAAAQARAAQAAGCSALIVGQGAGTGLAGALPHEWLSEIDNIEAVCFWGAEPEARDIRIALSRRAGAITPLLLEENPMSRLVLERHLCIDTTAAGGNTRLLAAAGNATCTSNYHKEKVAEGAV